MKYTRDVEATTNAVQAAPKRIRQNTTDPSSAHTHLADLTNSTLQNARSTAGPIQILPVAKRTHLDKPNKSRRLHPFVRLVLKNLHARSEQTDSECYYVRDHML